MKIKKLNPHGFSHEVLAIVIVAIFVVIGVGYLVATHAAPQKAVAHTASGDCVTRYFFVGSRSGCVQYIVIALDYESVPGAPHITVPKFSHSNYYGPGISRAVSFLQSHYMHVRANGKVSPSTWNSLCSILFRAGQNSNANGGIVNQQAYWAMIDAHCSDLGYPGL